MDLFSVPRVRCLSPNRTLHARGIAMAWVGNRQFTFPGCDVRQMIWEVVEGITYFSVFFWSALRALNSLGTPVGVGTSKRGGKL